MSSPVIGARSNFIPPNAELNSSHPLSAGLVFCYITSLCKDFAYGYQIEAVYSTTNTSAYSLTKYGRAQAQRLVPFSLPGNAQFPQLAFTTGAFSVGAVSLRTAALNNQVAFGKGNVGVSASRGWGLRWILSSGFWSFDVGGTFANTSLSAVSDPSTSQPLVNIVGTSNGIDTRKIYINGALNNSSSAVNINPSGTSNLGDNTNLGIFSGYVTSGNNIPTVIGCAWTRELSENEVALFNSDPFCMLNY